MDYDFTPFLSTHPPFARYLPKIMVNGDCVICKV